MNILGRISYHVVYNKRRGGWDVKKAGADRVSGHFDIKKEAVDYGRELSRRNGGELIIHGMDGKIQGADSHGNDPHPPKG